MAGMVAGALITALSGVASQAAKDGYAALKQRVVAMAKGDDDDDRGVESAIDRLEADPTNGTVQAVVDALLAELGADDDSEARKLADQIHAESNTETHQRDTAIVKGNQNRVAMGNAQIIEHHE